MVLLMVAIRSGDDSPSTAPIPPNALDNDGSSRADGDEKVARQENDALIASQRRSGAIPVVSAVIGQGSVPFRDALRWTDEDHETKRRHQEALTKGPNDYFSLLADTSTPLIPWKKEAKPIVCDHQEYYSGHFSIPEENIVRELPQKKREWATVVPGRKETYVFKSEASYRKDLEEAYFGITRRRYGFATNRNLEMLAAGCIPYFCGIQRVPKTGTLDSLPLAFFEQMVKFPGVGAKCFPPKKAVGFPFARGDPSDRSMFNETRYNLLGKKLLDYTRSFQSTTHLAKYILSATSLQFLPRRVLVLWASHYTIMLTGFIHGLLKLGVEVEDVPRRPEVYLGEGCEASKSKTYAKGWFFFCKANETNGLTRSNIKERIEKREFDLIVISITDTLTYFMKDPFVDVPHYETILRAYPRDRIVTMNDADLIKRMQADVAHKFMHNTTIYFKRETHGCNEPIW